MRGIDAPASERIDAPKRQGPTFIVFDHALTAEEVKAIHDGPFVYTEEDLRELEQRVKTDCYKANRIELRRVRRKCYAMLGGVLMAGWLLGLVFSAVVVCLFPAF